MDCAKNARFRGYVSSHYAKTRVLGVMFKNMETKTREKGVMLNNMIGKTREKGVMFENNSTKTRVLVILLRYMYDC